MSVVRTKSHRSLRLWISAALVFAVGLFFFRLEGNVKAAALVPGDLLVVDSGTKTLYRVDRLSGAQTPISANGLFTSPRGVAIESNGQILVLDRTGVIRVDPNTGAQVAVSLGGLFVNPFGIAIEPGGSILVADSDGGSTTPGCSIGPCGTVIRVNGQSGLQTRLSGDGNLLQPMGIAVAPSGDIYVIDNRDRGSSGGGVLLKIDRVSGAQTVVSSNGFFSAPSSVVIEATGQILVGDANAMPPPQGPGAVIRVNPVGGAQTVVAHHGFFAGQRGLALATNGEILVADPEAFSGGGGIIAVNPTTGAQTVVSSGGVFRDPWSVATVTSAPQPTCPTSLSPSQASFGAAGGPQMITVTAALGCNWFSRSLVPWITLGWKGVLVPPSLLNQPVVLYEVAQNTTNTPRSGVISVGDLIFTVTQAAGGNCGVQVTPTSTVFAATGGTQTVSIQTGSGCAWSAGNQPSWITFPFGSSGSGSTQLTFAVAPSGGLSRSGTFSVNGVVIQVTQGGSSPSPTVCGAINITNQVVVQPGFRVANLAAIPVSYYEELRITVSSSVIAPIPGPVFVILDGTPTPGTMLMSNAYFERITYCQTPLPTGSYLVRVSSGPITAGQVFRIGLSWSGTAPYTARVVSGNPSS